MVDDISNPMDLSLSKLWDAVKDREALACCSSWDRKESDTTQRLNNNNTPSVFFSKRCFPVSDSLNFSVFCILVGCFTVYQVLVPRGLKYYFTAS